MLSGALMMLLWPGVTAGQDSSAAEGMISEVQAVHLVEYLWEARRLSPRPSFESLRTVSSGPDHLYEVTGRVGTETVRAIVDRRTARVLTLSRGAKLVHRWPGPVVVGHRGSVQAAPENTIPAFLAAIERGAQLIEMDVRQTSDDRFVVIHDVTVDRTTNGRGPVAGMTLAELKKLDAGSWFDPKFKDVRIPTLEEALESIRGRAAPDIDFKAGDPDQLRAVLKTAGVQGSTFYCGDWRLLERAMKGGPSDYLWRPSVPVGLAGLSVLLEKLNPPIVNVDWAQFSEPLVREIHLAGRASFLNTMQHDNEFGIGKMLDTAPDYIQSDRMDLLMPLLKKYRARIEETISQALGPPDRR